MTDADRTQRRKDHQATKKAIKEQDAEMLEELLDEAIEKENSFLALSAKMGSSNSYISSVPLTWFANAHFASDLDVFDEYRDETGKSVAINKETLDLISQRKPDWSRQLIMTAYLAVRPHHKFPPVLLVAYQDWIFDENHDKWGADGRALFDSVTRESLSSNNWVVDLNHQGTYFYALDGQHRLMAVKGLRDLLDGNLSQKNKEGKPRPATAITIDDIMRHHSDEGDPTAFKNNLNAIMQEKIGIEIVPMVQVGETKEGAFARLRQVFVDVNLNARRLEKGELALLDETDGYSIVGRRLMVDHALFVKSDGSLRVDPKSSQINEKSEIYTTLQTIVTMAREYLGQSDEFSGWKNEIFGIKGAGVLRPSDEDLEEGMDCFRKYLDVLLTLPSHTDMINGAEVSTLRSGDDGGRDHILFRPLTQEALAIAIGGLQVEKDLSLKTIFRKIAEKDNSDNPDLRLTSPASPFFGILCHPIEQRMRRQEKYKNLAAEMFRYLLDGGFPEESDRERLRKDVFKSRRITLEEDDAAMAVNYDGKQVPLDKFKLPPPW